MKTVVYKSNLFGKKTNVNQELVVEFIRTCLKVMNLCVERIPLFDVGGFAEDVEDIEYIRLDSLEELCDSIDRAGVEIFKASARSNYLGIDRPLVKLVSASTMFEIFYAKASEYKNAYIALSNAKVANIAVDMKSIIADIAYGLRESLNLAEAEQEDGSLAIDKTLEQACVDSGLKVDEVVKQILDLTVKYPTNLPVFEEHPELIEALAQILPASFLETIVDFGDYVTMDEVVGMISGKISVDEGYVKMIEERASEEGAVY